MDLDDITHALPDGGTLRTIGPVAIVSTGPDRLAVCRTCGRELATWRAGERPGRLRCECTAAVR